jgi:hypothetical protein
LLKRISALFFTLCPVASAIAQETYFLTRGRPESDFSDFVIALSDPSKIARARAIAAGKARGWVAGTVLKGTQPYNPRWHFYIESSSISFPQVSIEVCDATPSYVESHLDEVGSAFLPKSHWCPWHQSIIKELDFTPSRR